MRTVRSALLATAMLLATAGGVSVWAQPSTTPLPTPRMEGGMPLMLAMAKRQSTRAFAAQPLPDQMLSDLLWAANGVNRPEQGERTAPSWRGGKAIDIYVATAQGVKRYDAVKHALSPHLEADIRAETGRQPFPATAPVVLIYVADRARMPEAPAAEQALYAHVDASLIAQNVYLFAASEGLATVMLGNVEREALAKSLKLRNDQILTFTQPIGYPR
jgi:nitroreductase